MSSDPAGAAEIEARVAASADRDALVRVVLAGLREGWRDDYSSQSVAEAVADHILAARLLAAHPDDAAGGCPQGGEHEPFAAGDARDGGPVHCRKCQAPLRVDDAAGGVRAAVWEVGVQEVSSTRTDRLCATRDAGMALCDDYLSVLSSTSFEVVEDWQDLSAHTDQPGRQWVRFVSENGGEPFQQRVAQREVQSDHSWFRAALATPAPEDRP